MKFSFKWLKEYVDIDISAEELADRLSLAGQEIESLEEVGAQLRNVVSGRIDKIEAHPDADKLVVCQISDGKSQHQIVTGAKNVFEGAIVPVALPGANLVGGLKIRESKLRGVQSNGMLCSEAELGVAEDAEGIWILPEDTPLGVDFIDYADLHDWVLELGILPNRGDCQSVIGLAREIAVILGKELRYPEISFSTTKIDSPLSLKTDSTAFCPLYLGRTLQNVSDGKSPLWMQRRLQLSDIRPISCIVDISNYVLLEWGQPLHTFDARKLTGSVIQIRAAKKGEKITTLDGEARDLSEDNVIIADDSGAIAVAGVMGGQSTEIEGPAINAAAEGPSASAEGYRGTVFLEAAYFNPTSVRRSAHFLGLRSESSSRFEKGVDINGVRVASDRACQLLQELCGAEVSDTLIELKDENSPLFSTKEVEFSADKINRLLGSDYSLETMTSILDTLGFDVSKIKGKGNERIIVPTWRANDITEWPCLAEEVARIKGFDDIPTTVNTSFVPSEPTAKSITLGTELERFFINRGATQLNSFPMISAKEISALGLSVSQNLTLQNPINPEEAVMRPSLLPSLLKAVSFNLKRQVKDMTFVEFGKTYLEGDDSDHAGVREERHCDAIFCGASSSNVYTKEDEPHYALNFLKLKGLASDAIASLGIDGVTFQESTLSYYHPIRQLELQIDNVTVGHLGTLHPQIAKEFKISEDVIHLHINVSSLLTITQEPPVFNEISKFPSTRRDIAILAPKDLPYADIEAAIQKYKPKTVSSFFLFDSFESEKIGNDKKSLAFAFVYNVLDRTLEDDEVNNAHQRFSDFLTKQLPISIR